MKETTWGQLKMWYNPSNEWKPSDKPKENSNAKKAGRGWGVLWNCENSLVPKPCSLFINVYTVVYIYVHHQQGVGFEPLTLGLKIYIISSSRRVLKLVMAVRAISCRVSVDGLNAHDRRGPRAPKPAVFTRKPKLNWPCWYRCFTNTQTLTTILFCWHSQFSQPQV